MAICGAEAERGMDVLHVIPHMGGGAGKVLNALVQKLQRYGLCQEIVCFESVNPAAKAWSARHGAKIHEEISPESAVLYQLIEKADIVHVHFWNHPTLYHFMHAFSGKQARVVLWAYVNGVHAPQAITEEALAFGALFVLSTPYSLRASAVHGKNRAWKRRHMRTVFMTAGTDGFDDLVPGAHEKFRIGYVGTVSSCKMHKNFVGIASRLVDDGAEYVVCGGPDHAALAEEIRRYGLDARIKIPGPVADIRGLLPSVDVFAYPLCPENYGTGEQALIEAMAAGVPQVVLAGGPEACVVRHGLTGIVAESEDGFVEAVRLLRQDGGLRKRLSANSSKYAREHYSIDSIGRQWNEIYTHMMCQKKETCLFLCEGKKFPGHMELFLKSLGRSSAMYLYQRFFEQFPHVENTLKNSLAALPRIFSGRTRGSLRHYAAYFRQCQDINAVADFLYKN